MTTPSPDLALQPCPSCGAPAGGRFCAGCGAALAGASCGSCAAPLTPGARFCHRCGTPAASSTATTGGVANMLPWAVAGLALLCLIALVVGQRFGARNTPAPDAATTATTPFAGSAPTGAMPRAPDISQMSPAERAERLYDRIMSESEAGRTENVRTFMPMAIAAFEMLAPLSLDQRYDLGRIGEVGGDAALARAQADSILRDRPAHLLGLILAAKAARLEKQDARAREFDARLLAAEPTERAAGLAEYLVHKNDIDAALSAARSTNR